MRTNSARSHSYLHGLPILLISCIVSLSSCSMLPHYEGNAEINSIATGETAQVQRSSFPAMPSCVIAQENDPCFHPMFIGVAISGGGSRAANFSLGAIAQLSNLGLYDSVTALSSVSGGSLTAAAVGLKPIETEEDFSNLAAEFRKDFLTSWVLHSLSPPNLASSMLTGRNATRTLADVFDNEIFHGATYRDLGKREPGKPLLFINGSLMNHVAGDQSLTTRDLNSATDSLQGFAFTETAFEHLSSDLNKLRIADAVAASGAYPGLFEPLTLKNFTAENKLFDLPGSKFLHVSDGGASDNLGVDALIRAYSEILPTSQNMSCLLILVDAHVNDQGDQRGNHPDGRSKMADYIVSPSFNRAFDLLLDQRRESQLRELGISLATDHPHRFNSDAVIPLRNYAFSGSGYAALTHARSMREGEEGHLIGGRAVNEAHCAVWHVALDRLVELTAKGSRREREAFHFEHDLDESTKDESAHDIQLIKLDRFVSAIETNYKLSLSGSGNCSRTKLQNALFETARVLMTQDKDSIKQLKTWLELHHRADFSRRIAALLESEEFHKRYEAIHVPEFSVLAPDWRNPMESNVDCIE